MRALFLLVLVACGAPQLSTLDDDAPVEVRTAVQGKTSARGGRFELVVEHDADIEVEWPEVRPARLEIEQDGEVREERIGDRIVRTGQYTFTAAKGSYVVPAVLVRFEDEGVAGAASSQPLYVDLGVEAPRPGELADISDPAPRRRFPWWLAGTALAVLALFVAGLAVAFRKGDQRELAAVPPEPPDVIALRAWEAIRESSLSDYDKALGVSRIYRDYAESVLSFKATALTTTEILERLRHMVHLDEGNLPRSKRLLRATDRIKFADVDAHDALFDELDADLRAFVDSTRPHHWEPEEQGEKRVIEERPTFDAAWWLLISNRVAAAGAAGGAAALMLAMGREFRAAGLPIEAFVGTLVVASVLLVIAAMHGALSVEVTAKRLKWVQIPVGILYLVFIPIGTVYGLGALYFAFFADAGRQFYGRGAT
ncbi:MAG: hypothetical protein KC912_19210 [Proteobacteria bacterium]|nr:hypothetical protein [Pseudomonadota bacterium]